MAMPQCQIIAPQAGLLQLQGELRFTTVLPLLARGRELIQSAAGRCQLDLAGVGYCDSAGLALLIEWQRLAVAAGGAITLLHPPEQLRRLAAASDLDAILALSR